MRKRSWSSGPEFWVVHFHCQTRTTANPGAQFPLTMKAVDYVKQKLKDKEREFRGLKWRIYLDRESINKIPCWGVESDRRFSHASQGT